MTDPKKPRTKRTIEQQRADLEAKIAALDAKNSTKNRKKIADIHAAMRKTDANGTPFTDQWLSLEGMIESWLSKPGAAS